MYKKGTWDLANVFGGVKPDGVERRNYLGFVAGWALAPAGKEGKEYKEIWLTDGEWHSFWDEVDALRNERPDFDVVGTRGDGRCYFDDAGLPHPIADYKSF